MEEEALVTEVCYSLVAYGFIEAEKVNVLQGIEIPLVHYNAALLCSCKLT